ncbi:MAG: Rpn family recombination-promoting nuclease/putative transposase [Clostridium sp.]|nr:Rpn family recombination-promoting nuclease/putative transposase [Clostridium sp.]
MADFLMRPKIDYAFKEIMMDEQARIGFLSAVLKLNPADVRKTELLNTNLRKLHEDEKQGIVDIRILMNNNTEIDIEIQLSILNVWADRALFYLAKMYTDQIRPGQDYTVFKKCVSISILDFILFREDPEFYSCFHIREDSRHTLYTDKMEFHVLELPKLPQELKEGSSDILLWAAFINSERKEDFDMLATKNPYISSAYKHLQVISQDREKRLEYEAREKAIRDYNQGILEAEQRGREEGKAEARTEGIQILIADHKEEEIPKEKTLAKLQKHYHLTESQAETYYIEFTKENP